jgi:hypothetical protein
VTVQGDLFDAPDAVVELAPPCMFGTPTVAGTMHAPGWTGPHHCEHCASEVERGRAEFAAAVARGEFDAQGYTPAERRQLEKRKRKADVSAT